MSLTASQVWQRRLMRAAESGRIDDVKALFAVELDMGGDLNAADESGSNALVNATAAGSLEIVRYLVDEQSADLNYYDASGFGAVTVAAYLGDLDLVRYFVTHRLYVPPPTPHHPLFAASSVDGIDLVRFLVEERGCAVDEVGPHGWTPAMMAAKSGLPIVLQYLVARGASLTAENEAGQTLDGVVATAEVTERTRAKLRNAVENGTDIAEQERTRRDVEAVRRAVEEHGRTVADGGSGVPIAGGAPARPPGDKRSCRRSCQIWFPLFGGGKKE